MSSREARFARYRAGRTQYAARVGQPAQARALLPIAPADPPVPPRQSCAASIAPRVRRDPGYRGGNIQPRQRSFSLRRLSARPIHPRFRPSSPCPGSRNDVPLPEPHVLEGHAGNPLCKLSVRPAVHACQRLRGSAHAVHCSSDRSAFRDPILHAHTGDHRLGCGHRDRSLRIGIGIRHRAAHGAPSGDPDLAITAAPFSASSRASPA